MFHLHQNTLHSIFHWNSCFSPPIGFAINFSLFLLIIFATPKEMLAHSKILLQTCFVDILLLSIQIIGLPMVIHQDGLGVAIYQGYLIRAFKRAFGGHSICHFHLVWFTFQLFDSLAVVIQFIHRYFQLNRNFTIGMCRQFMMLFLTFLFCILLTTFFHLIYDRLPAIPTNRNDGQFNSGINSIILQGNMPFCIMEMKENMQIYFALVNTMFIVIFYAVIIFCSWKMIRFVAFHSALDPGLKLLNRKLTKTLIILALLPLLMSIIFQIFQLGPIFFGAEENQKGIGPLMAIQMLLGLPISWVPILNPLITIFVNKPYRDVLLRKCARKIVPINQQKLPPVKIGQRRF